MTRLEQLVQSGRKQLAGGDYAGALARAEAALIIDTACLEALQLRARALYLLGRDAEAFAVVRQWAACRFQISALPVAPDGDLCQVTPPAHDVDVLETLLALRARQQFDVELLLLLAQLAEQAGRVDLAREVYADVISVDANHLPAWEGWIRSLFHDDLDAALQALTAAVARFPAQPIFHAHLGIIFFRRHRFAEAQAAFHRALDYAPDHLEFREALVLCHLAQGEHDAAVALMTRLTTTDPDNAALHRFAIEVALRAGDFDMAMHHAHQLVRVQPAHADTYCLKAFVELAQGLPDSAQRTMHLGYHKALEGSNTLFRLVDLLIGNGEVGAAQDVVTMADTLAPDHPDTHAAHGKVLREMGQLPAALAAFEHAATLAPQDDSYLTWIGIVLENMGEYAQAMRYFNRVLSRHPHDAWTLGNRGVVYLALGNPELALEDLTRALELEGDDAQLLFWRAGSRMQLDDGDGAFHDLSRAVDLDDEVLVWLDHEPGFVDLRNDPRVRAWLARRHDTI